MKKKMFFICDENKKCDIYSTKSEYVGVVVEDVSCFWELRINIFVHYDPKHHFYVLNLMKTY